MNKPKEELKSPRLNKRLSSSQTSISGSNTVQPLKDAIPFNLMEHGSRYRRQSCESEIQHILFVLDTSGSIGQANFETVTRILGGLTTLFCDRKKIAVMTFDHEYYVEFSFDRYRDDHIGRIDAGNDIESIPSVGNKKKCPSIERFTNLSSTCSNFQYKSAEMA